MDYIFMPNASFTIAIKGRHLDVKAGTPITVDKSVADAMLAPNFRYRSYIRLVHAPKSTFVPTPKVEEVKVEEMKVESIKLNEVEETTKLEEVEPIVLEEEEEEPKRKSRRKTKSDSTEEVIE